MWWPTSEKIRNICRNALKHGDVETLTTVGNLREFYGIANTKDLGNDFSKYGSGFEKWNEMIADATKNNKCSAQNSDVPIQEQMLKAFNQGDINSIIILLEVPVTTSIFGRSLKEYENQPLSILYDAVHENRKDWITFCDKFNKAFYTGDISTLCTLKTLGIIGFDNFSDLGSSFEKYDSMIYGWEQLISDATTNK